MAISSFPVTRARRFLGMNEVVMGVIYYNREIDIEILLPQNSEHSKNGSSH